jgi:hypothetical protein
MPLSKAIKPRPIVTCDIETWGLDARPEAFALGVVYDGEKAVGFTYLPDMRNYLISPRFAGHAIYAHNGGKFDYLALFGNYWKFFGADNVTMNESRFIQATYRDVKARSVVYFRDSLNIIPASLAKIGEKFGSAKGETPSKFIEAKRGPLEPTDWEYCKQDCKLLWEALTYFQERLGGLRSTLPSTAMAVFRREFFPAASPIRICRKEDLSFRDAYYGGRVEAYRLGKLSLPNFTYDINSLYPTAMRRAAFPQPDCLTEKSDVTPQELVNDLMASYEGFASCAVRHPDAPLGYLPHVSEEGKLTFPVGNFAGSWCFPELRYFMSHGGDIQSVSRVIYAPRMSSPFVGYVDKYYRMKREADGFERDMAKLMLNALYGKFGEYHEQNQRYAEGFDETTLAEYRRVYGAADFEPISRTRSDGYYVFPSRDSGIAGHSVFAWAAYITSMARVINLETQEAIRAVGEVYYTDTDSFTATTEIGTSCGPDSLRHMVGDELGQLKLESVNKQEIRGNKHYVLEDGSVVLKGVKRGAKLIDGAYRWDSIVGLKESIRRRIVPGTPLVRARAPVSLYDKRVVHEDGSTEPIHLTLNESYTQKSERDFARLMREDAHEQRMRVFRKEPAALMEEWERLHGRLKNRVPSWTRTRVMEGE